MIITYKYKLKKGFYLKRHKYAINKIWNYCVETQKKTELIRKQGTKKLWPSHFDLTRLTKGVSIELRIHAQTIQSICSVFTQSRDLNKRCPKFRSIKKSLGWIPFQTQSRSIKDNSITYLGQTFKWFGSKKRPLPAEGVKGGCFAEDARGNWYICFQVEVKEDNNHGAGKVGIDLGLKHLAACSNGEKYETPRYYRKSEKKLKIARRSNNKKRTKAIHAKIKNQRQDFLHKLSHKLVKENELIVVGNVSAVKLAKTRMAKSVLDAGWAALRAMLRYKASRHGAQYREVNEFFTSQTCSSCGSNISSKRPKGIAGLGIREWVCDSCGTSHDRDINAAKNILALGLGTQPLAEENYPKEYYK